MNPFSKSTSSYTQSMKKNIALLILLVLLAGFASAEFASDRAAIQPGELLTLSANDLPPTTEMASFALGGPVHGQIMQRRPDGTWEGKFAILPSMAGTTLEPVITARLENGDTKRVTLPRQKVGLNPQLKSGDGFATKNKDGSVLFVFDETIRLDTVDVITKSGARALPRYHNNYFQLPPSIRANDVLEIRAESIHGERLEIGADQSLQAAWSK